MNNFEVTAYATLYALAETESDAEMCANFRKVMSLASPEVQEAGEAQGKYAVAMADLILGLNRT